MATRSFQNNGKITDWSATVSNIPNDWDTVTSLNLFTQRMISTLSFTWDETTEGTTLLTDSPRGVRRTYGSQGSRKTHSVVIPHFNYDDYLTPIDLQDIRKDGSPDAVNDLATEKFKVLQRISGSYADTFEKARMNCIIGDAYAPNGTVVQNWYTEYGKTQLEFDYDFANITNATLMTLTSGIIGAIQDNLFNGQKSRNQIVLCSPEFFDSLTTSDAVGDVYLHYLNNGQFNQAQVLRDRLGSPIDVRERRFSHLGLTYIEYRGEQYDSATDSILPIIPAGDAYALPIDVSGIFEEVYAPALKFSTVNKPGQVIYTFESGDDDSWTYQTESNFIFANHRPAAVQRLHSST